LFWGRGPDFWARPARPEVEKRVQTGPYPSMSARCPVRKTDPKQTKQSAIVSAYFTSNSMIKGLDLKLVEGRDFLETEYIEILKLLIHNNEKYTENKNGIFINKSKIIRAESG
jgi:hypothetical protein